MTRCRQAFAVSVLVTTDPDQIHDWDGGEDGQVEAQHLSTVDQEVEVGVALSTVAVVCRAVIIILKMTK